MAPLTKVTSHHNVCHEPVPAATNFNKPSDAVPYFTPAQEIPAGMALIAEGQKSVPKLFRPLKLRGMMMANRVVLSPMCQYSAEDGHYTMWHKTHMGGIIQRGPGLACVEATSVTANGRITPEDSGLWKDSQITPLKEVVDFAHSQNQKIMIQLGHAGRKASTVAPWLSGGMVASEELHGWPDDVWGPSAIAWDENHASPKEMTLDQIAGLKKAFNDSVKRALAAGFDAIEIHGAHGYLLHEFMSPVSNQRKDKYGGNFENRIRLIMELVEETRATIPKNMPLFVRISATDWLEEAPKNQVPESWTLEDSIELAKRFADAGVDLLDVSTGGNSPLQHPHVKQAYQAPFAIAIKKAVGDKMAVTSVGNIDNATIANQLLEKDGLDAVVVARPFQKNPGLIFAWGDELGQAVRMPNQIQWGFVGRHQEHSQKPITDFPELM